MTPEQVVDKINGMFATKMANVPTEDDFAELKTQIEELKTMIGGGEEAEEKRVGELEKSLAKFEGKLEAMSERGVAKKTRKARNLGEAMSMTYEKNLSSIQDAVEKRQSINLEVKEMTINGDYTDANGNLGEGVALTTLDTEIDKLPRPVRRIRQIANVGTTSSKFVTYIQQTAQPFGNFEGGEGTEGWTAEGILKPAGEIKYEEVSVEVKKIAGTIKVSKEMLADLAFVRSEINSELMQSIEQGVDWAMINGSGGAQITGLLNAGLPNYISGVFAGVVPGANILDVIRILKAQVQAANQEPTHVLLHPEDVAKLEISKSSTGEYTFPYWMNGQLLVSGLVIVPTTNIAPDTIVIGDFSKLIVKIREDVNMTVGYENDDFTRNMVTILAEARLVQYIKNNQLDAFVTDSITAVIADIVAP
jgi:HK97 family phage major capsid protein